MVHTIARSSEQYAEANDARAKCRRDGEDNAGIREHVLLSRIVEKTIPEKRVLRYVFIVVREYAYMLSRIYILKILRKYIIWLWMFRRQYVCTLAIYRGRLWTTGRAWRMRSQQLGTLCARVSIGPL